jgi:hypothetical protein
MVAVFGKSLDGSAKHPVEEWALGGTLDDHGREIIGGVAHAHGYFFPTLLVSKVNRVSSSTDKFAPTPHLAGKVGRDGVIGSDVEKLLHLAVEGQ